MDIGTKIKNSRLSSGLTQEQAAEALAFGNFNLPDLTLWLVGAIISLAGLGIGTLVRRHIRKKKIRCTNP